MLDTWEDPDRDLTLKASTAIQSVLLPRSRFTLAEARAWLKEHGYHETKAPDITGKYYRFRQADPSNFKRLRTKELSGGIKLIIGWK